MRAILLFLVLAYPPSLIAQQTVQGTVQGDQQQTEDKKPAELKDVKRLGVGQAVTAPVRHPIKTQKAVAKGVKKVAKFIW